MAVHTQHETRNQPPPFTPAELEELVVATGEAAARLRAEADRVRAQVVGEEVHLRAIIEFSSFCDRHCRYCGLRVENDGLRRYRMSLEEVLAAAEVAAAFGFGTVVLQSGEDLWYTGEGVASLVRQIKARTPLAITLALGEREASEYRLWREAGADRYLLKHETADPDLYARLHPGGSFENRLRCQETLRELGYQVGSGCIVGLPGQTPRSLALDLLHLQRLQVHMCGLGPLIPHPATPLGPEPVGSPEITLNMVALTRLLVPDVMLAATTALETALPGQGRLRALQGGANVVMPNLTPRRYASDYEIYPGKQAPKISLEAEVERAKDVVRRAGRPVATGPGHSPRETLNGER